MFELITRKPALPAQYIAGSVFIILISFICFLCTPWFDYKSVALILLLSVSIIAAIFDILPTLLAAVLSAAIWDFFFIPPRYTFHISASGDILMLSMYFMVALINAILTYRIRQIEKKLRIKEEKEKMLEFYNTIFNSLSHELKTPLSAIIGASDLMQENNKDLSIQQKEELIIEISSSALRLQQQVDNLLQMSRIESGAVKLRTQWVDMEELIHGVISRLPPHHHPVKVNLQEHLPFIKTDELLTEHILVNLIRNAIQYTPPTSTVTIQAITQNDEGILISIIDEGEGIYPDEVDKVFQKFYRPAGNPVGGTGLGLSIVKGFIQLMGGYISLDNHPGKGCTFHVYIPGELTYINNLKNE